MNRRGLMHYFLMDDFNERLMFMFFDKTQSKFPVDTMYKSATPLKIHIASLPGQ